MSEARAIAPRMQPSVPRKQQAALAAANVSAVLSKYPVYNKPDVLAFVDGDFEDVPKVCCAALATGCVLRL